MSPSFFLPAVPTCMTRASSSPAPASQTRRFSARRKPDNTKRSMSFLFTPKETLLYPTPDLKTSCFTLCSSQMSPIALQPKPWWHRAQEHFQHLSWISFSRVQVQKLNLWWQKRQRSNSAKWFSAMGWILPGNQSKMLSRPSTLFPIF